MKHSNFSRILAFLLALVMVLSMAPARVFASDSAVYNQITSAGELTTGKYVLVVSSGYAPSVFDNGWVLAEETKVIDQLDGLLTLKGLRLIYERNKA